AAVRDGKLIAMEGGAALSGPRERPLAGARLEGRRGAHRPKDQEGPRRDLGGGPPAQAARAEEQERRRRPGARAVEHERGRDARGRDRAARQWARRGADLKTKTEPAECRAAMLGGHDRGAERIRQGDRRAEAESGE